MRFIIIIAVYNMERWIGDNIQSIKNQTHSDFRCFIGDDISDDNSRNIIDKHIQGDSRFTLVRHQQKKFSMGNIYSLIELAKPGANDIIVLVDGDDKLAHNNVLKKLAEIYTKQECWMTYGSYSADGKTPDNICTPYPKWVIKLNRFRWVKWRASHLKTFRYALWQQIPDSAFSITESELARAKRRALLFGRLNAWWHWRKIKLEAILDPGQQFARRCSDKNMTIPMLDLAGQHAYFVEEILYIYITYDKDLDFDKKPVHQRWFTRLIRDILWNKQRLKPLKKLPLD